MNLCSTIQPNKPNSTTQSTRKTIKTWRRALQKYALRRYLQHLNVVCKIPNMVYGSWIRFLAYPIILAPSTTFTARVINCNLLSNKQCLNPTSCTIGLNLLHTVCKIHLFNIHTTFNLVTKIQPPRNSAKFKQINSKLTRKLYSSIIIPKI